MPRSALGVSGLFAMWTLASPLFSHLPAGAELGGDFALSLKGGSHLNDNGSGIRGPCFVRILRRTLASGSGSADLVAGFESCFLHIPTEETPRFTSSQFPNFLTCKRDSPTRAYVPAILGI